MNSIQLIRRLFDYLRWCENNVIQTCRPLSREQLEQRFEIGMGSLWASIVHLYAAELAWMNAIDGNPVGTLASTDDIPGWDVLDNAWGTLRTRWDRYLEQLDEQALDTIVRKARALPGQSNAKVNQRVYETSAADVLMHVCSHATYTMSQAINMLRHLGVEPLPSAMHIQMARDELIESD